MDKIMLSVLNMSITASFVILAVCAARLLLKKAPKAISYALWAVVAFRLLVPFSFESVFSLLPIKPEPIPQDIVYQAQPRIDSGINVIDNAVSGFLPAATPTTASINPMQIILAVGSWLWLIGIAVMLIYSFVTIYLLKRRLRGAVLMKDNIYEADNIKTPFVLGFIRPKIYIPAELKAEEKGYIILHEQTHIRRHDHIVKLIAYFTLCLHWFNPFAWLAFVLMGTDMELSCDERVLKELGTGIKKDYSASLLSLSTGHRIINGSPLAFGEGGIKTRIKNVLNFKKSSRIIIIVAVMLVAVVGVGFMANRSSTIDLPAADSVLFVTMNQYDENTPVGEVVIKDPSEISQLLDALSRSTKTGRQSIHDTPIGGSYLTVQLQLENGTRTLYLYTDGADYIEDPYVGIYRPRRGQFNFIHSMYSAYSRGNIGTTTLTAADIGQIKVGMTMDEVHNILGEPHGMLSGLYGEVYALVGGEQATIYYGGENATVENVLITGNKGEESIFFRTGSNAYRPDFISISAQLMNVDRETTLNCGNAFSLLKLVGNNSWELVPFKNDIGFDDIGMILEYGDSQSFNLTPDMLTANLAEGRYRFEAEVWYDTDPIVRQIVWAEFSIDKNAEEQITYTWPPNWFATTDGKDMTLDDVRALAEKGDNLVLDDIMGFNGINFSSGFDQNRYINIENSYVLTVRSPPDAKPDSVILSVIGNTTGDRVDIRYGDIDAFINDRPIHMSLKEETLSPTGATIILKNLTDSDYTYGEAFVLQRIGNGNWTDVEIIIDNYAFNDIGYSLRGKETDEMEVNWEWLYGKLRPGDYRIVKEALFIRSPGDYDTYTIYATFTIVD